MIDDFIAAKRAEGCSVSTCKQYRWHLRRFADFLEPESLPPTRAQIRNYIAGVRDDFAPATVKVAVTVIRSYCAWLVAEGLLTESPAAGFKIPKVPRTAQRTLTAAELAAMLKSCGDSHKGLRDAALLSLMADTGLRRAEICSLTPNNLSFADRLVVDVVRKGGAVGWASFGVTTAARLHSWLDVRHPASGVTALFVAIGGSYPGQPLTGDGLRTIVRKIGESCGIAGVSPHAFRRSFACLLVEAGAPTRLIQSMGGWSNVAMVERYTMALDSQRLAAQWSPMDLLSKNDGESPYLPIMPESEYLQ